MNESDSSRQVGRRRFFKYFVNTIGSAIAAAIAVPLAGFFALPALKKSEALWKEAGPVDDFLIGEIKLALLKPLTRREWPEDWGTEAAWIHRKSRDEFVAYNIHCTHVGCPVNWSPRAKRFFSPCHGGVFDADGRVLAGPPPRPLDRYDLKVENGVLYAGQVYRLSDSLERLA